MGCGKTYWGHALSKKLGLPFFDLDQQIEEKEGKNITEIFAGHGEEQFRLLEKEVLHLLTESHEAFVMATGGGTPCFYNNIGYMKKSGTVVWLNCPVARIQERLLRERSKRPLISGVNDAELHAYISRKLADRRMYYEQATTVVTKDDFTVEELIAQIFNA